jgi:hypothetical protein
MCKVYNAFQIVPSRPTCYVIQIALAFRISAQGDGGFLKHMKITVYSHVCVSGLQ